MQKVRGIVAPNQAIQKPAGQPEILLSHQKLHSNKKHNHPHDRRHARNATERGKTNDSWQQLQEQEVELEENAAKEKMAAVLAQLDDQEKHEIELIDRALAKIKASALGICESCGRHISERRLEAIP
jgi:RNA polymerase-binding transcription factor DksA